MHLNFEDTQVIKNVFGANPSTADKIIELLSSKASDMPKNGEDGEDGRDGSRWYVQIIQPTDATEIDFWMNSETGEVHQLKNGKWKMIACLKGREGEDAKGEKGDTPIVIMGKVETLEPRSQVKASLTPTRKVNEYALNLAIPVGEEGVAPTMKAGDVIRLKPGSRPKVLITGEHPDYEINFSIPDGEKGDKGDTIKGDKGDLAQYREVQRIITKDGATHRIENSVMSELLVLISGEDSSLMTLEFPSPKNDQIIRIVSKVPVKNLRLIPEDRIASKPQSFTVNGFYEFFYDHESKIFYRTR